MPFFNSFMISSFVLVMVDDIGHDRIPECPFQQVAQGVPHHDDAELLEDFGTHDILHELAQVAGDFFPSTQFEIHMFFEILAFLDGHVVFA